MAFLVSLTARAERDLAALYDEIHASDSAAALTWYRGLRKAILSLEEMPQRCPSAREDPKLRNLLYGRRPRVYRVIYRIVERKKRVEVLHIRHGARQPIKRSVSNG